MDEEVENYAAIYYANAEWRPEWLGHTHYMPATARAVLRGAQHSLQYAPQHKQAQQHVADGLDISLAVLPKPQRLVIHDGRQCHVGTAPHRSFGGLRVTLAWKFALANSAGARRPSRP